MRIERADASGDPPDPTSGTRPSRRTFLRASGFLATIGTGGLAGAAGATDSGAVRVGATEPYLPVARTVSAAFERSTGEPVETEVSAAGAGPGPPVRLAGRPAPATVDGQGAGTDGSGSVTTRSVAIRGVRTLAAKAGEWHEPMARDEVARRFRSGRPVETWSETDGDALVELAESDAAVDAAGSVGDPSADREVLVLGQRAGQYARGHGGVAYYAVEPDDLTERSGPSATSLVRLEYLQVDPGALTDRGEAFVGFYARKRARPATLDRCFVDPSVDPGVT